MKKKKESARKGAGRLRQKMQKPANARITLALISLCFGLIMVSVVNAASFLFPTPVNPFSCEFISKGELGEILEEAQDSDSLFNYKVNYWPHMKLVQCVDRETGMSYMAKDASYLIRRYDMSYEERTIFPDMVHGLLKIACLIVGPLMALLCKAEMILPAPKSQPAPVAAATTNVPQGGTQRKPQAPEQKPQQKPAQPPQQPPVQSPPQDQQPANPPAQQQPVADDPVAATMLNVKPHVETITFDDIAGYDEVKKHMADVVYNLANPERLIKFGLKPTSGVLLYGPPGTGKTLMAKAIAGSAGVNFYQASASEFVNTYVGVGAQNVRNLYQQARENAPSVVFIDEIDAIGGARTGDQNQEYRSTLNALLTEMDGMSKTSGVLTIAATNDFEGLDGALIRPGRFDTKIKIPLPNYDDRLAIIGLYARKRNVDESVSLERLARDTSGMSGSGIDALLNEAGRRALRANHDTIQMDDIDGALTQMLTNGEVSKATNPHDLKAAAYHEAGHAILLKLLVGESVPKVSIVGSTSGLVGMTMRSETEERQMKSLTQLRKSIVATYGGRAAEELVFGRDEITTGASQDIRQASDMIREYLQFGAGSSLLNEEAFAGRSAASYNIEEARKLAIEMYNEAGHFLVAHRPKLEAVAQALLERETLLEDELNEILGIATD